MFRQISHCLLRKTNIAFILIYFFSFLTGTSLVTAQGSLEVVVHHIEAVPIEGEIAFDVAVFLSVFDSEGNAIEDLDVDNFSIFEESQPKEITSVDRARNAPKTIILVLDTSGSMARSMRAAREAAQEFVRSLGTNDQVAVISFDSTIKRAFPYSGDFSAAVDTIEGIDFTHNGGTCLYDAAYEAVEMANTVPSGRRAIILLTDGVDETIDRKICSTHKLEDVTGRAAHPGSHVPIYTIGLGENVDETILTRMAFDTSGRFIPADNADALLGLFGNISKQLNNQYVLHYTSTNTPGSHSIVVQAEYDNASDQELKDFVLPGLPPSISIEVPVENAKVSKEFQIVATVIERGLPVDNISFEINGTKIWAASEPPYEIEWDFGDDTGKKQIKVVAYDRSGKELSSDSIEITAIESATATVESQSTDLPVATMEPTVSSADTDSDVSADAIDDLTLYIIIAASVIILAIVIFIVLRRKKPKEEESSPKLFSDETVDDFVVGQPSASLMVESSDDRSMVGKDFAIIKFPTELGRSADNDIVFPGDTPVSRQHAVINKVKDDIVIAEISSQTSDGKPKRPKYGTFVNGKQVEGNELLRDGDEIQLGRRVRLRFRLLSSKKDSSFSDDMTFDDMDISSIGSDTDETMDA